MNTNPTFKDIMIGIVCTAAFMGVVFILAELLGKELFIKILLAVALGLMSYLIATWVASRRRIQQLQREREKMEQQNLLRVTN